jgi:uncharacterized protein YjiS (DUF1127 family)
MHHLAEMTDYQLQDVGLTRGQIRARVYGDASTA